MNKVFQLVWNHFSRTWVAAGETAKRNCKGRYAIDGILAALAALGVGISSAKPKAKNSQAFGLSCMTVALAMAQGGMVYAATPSPTALPTGAHIAAGQANIVQQNNTLTIQQQTDKLITNWQSFDIGSQATVNFQQPSSKSVALNRITNQDPTQILGNLNANGQIFLLNPAGIIIGNESQINVNTLVATTLNMTDQNFLDENYALTGDPNSLAKIVNQGTITTPEGGRVAMIAPVVENQGDIITPAGTTTLAAASEVELDLSGQGTLGIRIDKGTLNALVENQQLIQANNGQVILTARAVDALTKSVVNNDGIIEATSLTNKGGRIVLEGDDINLGSDTTIDASGATGGGDVLIGGDWQGSGDIYQAETVTMDNGAKIHADAITQGDGGKVVLWSDIDNTNSLTAVHGETTARGGSQGGDGGEIETSGHDLQFAGASVDAGANHGKSGLWFLDPVYTDINAAEASSISSSLETQDVTVTSTGNINVNSAISRSAGTGTTTLTLKANAKINQAASATISGADGHPLNVVVWVEADGGGSYGAALHTINTYGGHLWVGGGSGTATWNGISVGDGISMSDGSDNWNGLDLHGNITTSGGDIYLTGDQGNSAGNPSIGSINNITLNAGSGDIAFIVRDGDNFSYQNNTISLATTGTFTIAPPSGESFVSDIIWNGTGTTHLTGSDSLLGLIINNVASLGGISIGTYNGTGVGGDTPYVAANTQSIDINSAINGAGAITLYGNDIDLNAGITKNTGSEAKLLFKANNTIAIKADITSTSDKLNVVLWSDADGNGDGRVYIANHITTNGGGVWIGGSYLSHGSGTSWTPYAGASTVTVGDGYTATPNGANSGIYAPAGSITTAGGHITMYGYSNDDASDGNYGINLQGLNLSSGAGDISLTGIANSAETSGTYAAGTYIHKGSDIQSTSGNINISGTLGSASDFVKGTATWIGSTMDTTTATGDVSISTTSGSITINGTGQSTGAGNNWRYGTVLYPSVSDELSISSTSGNISISGEGNFHNVTYTGGLSLQTANTTTQLAVTSQTGDISLTGSNAQSGSIANQHALRFLNYDTANNIRIGYDGTNAYSGDITVKANSILTAVTNSGSGSLAFVTSGNIFIRPEDGDTSFSQDLDITDDWTFGSNANSMTLGIGSNTADITLDSALTTNGAITAYGGNITINDNLNSSAANTTGDVLLKASGNITLAANKSITTNASDAILWSNTDGAATHGGVFLGTSSSISTSGGHVWIGGSASNGGSTTWNGLTVGDGYAVGGTSTGHSTKPGVSFANATITTAGGNIAIYGSNTSTSSYGVETYKVNTINAGAGTVYIKGLTSGSGRHGIIFGVHSTSVSSSVTITSTSTSANAITIDGSTSVSSRYGIVFGDTNTLIASNGGGINITGSGTTGGGIHHGSGSSLNILANTGAINLSSGASTFNNVGTITIGAKSGTSVLSSSSNINITADTINNSGISINTSGAATIQSDSNSFSSAFSDSNWTLASSLTGLTIGNTGNTADITISNALTTTGPINLYAGNVTLNNNLNTSASNSGNILIKASGNISLSANQSITTNNGDVILWSNSDNIGDNGYILMRDDSSITTSGGHLWMGGGSGTSTWNGLSVGDGYAKAGAAVDSDTFLGGSHGSVQSGIYFENASINTSGGHLAAYGEGDDTGERGILSVSDLTIDVGAGKISLNAKSLDEISLIFGHHSLHSSSEIVTLSTTNTATDAITFNTTSANVGSGWSYGTWIEGTANLLATNGGGITLTTAGVANGINLGYSTSAGTLNMFSSAGDITLNTGTNGINVRTAGSSINLGRGGSTVTTSSSNLTIIADDFSSNGSLAFNTSGTLTIQPQAGNSFASTFDTANLTYANDVTGLTIGHANNTGGITIGSSTTIAGNVTLYGGNIAIDNALTLSNNGTLAITATGTISDGTNGAITAPKLAINGATSVTLDHANTDFDTIAATGVGAFTLVDKDDLTVDSVNPTGITATGDVSLSVDGTLTINEGISVGSNNLTIKADDFSFTANLSGSGNLTLSPVDSGVTMGVGSATATWQVTSANLTQLSDGFSQITIGSTTGGNLTVDGYNSWADDLVLQAGSSANLTVADDLTWSQADSLTLKAGNNIYLNGSLTASNDGAALNIYYGGSDSSTAPTAGTTYELDLSDYSTIDMTGTGPSLRIGNDSYTFIDAMADFVGMSDTGKYALKSNIDASATTYTAAVYSNTFKGKLDGLGHTIDGLKINSGSGKLGLFQELNNATVRHLGITNVDINFNFDGNTNVGALAGRLTGSSNANTTQIDGVWSTGLIKTDTIQTGAGSSDWLLAGGIVGNINGIGSYNLSRLFSTTTVAAANTKTSKLAIGGILGDISELETGGGAVTNTSQTFTLDRVWSTGSIVSGPQVNYFGIGGIVGVVYGYNTTNFRVSNAFSFGSVTSPSSVSSGGLYGYLYNTAASSGYSVRAQQSNVKIGGNIAGTATESNIYASITNSTWSALPAGLNANIWTLPAGKKPHLSALPKPPTPIYVETDNTSLTYGSATPSYNLVNSAGSAVNLGSGDYADLATPTGTAVYTITEDIDVGTYDTSYVKGLTLTGSDASSFILYPYKDAASVTITQKSLSASGLSVPNKVYDGNTSATLSAGNLSGVLSGDSVTLGGTATFASPDAATGINVAISGLNLSGSDAGNYNLTTTTGSTTADITAKTLTVSGTTIADKDYDGLTTASAHLGTISGYVGSETLTITPSASFTNANAGSYSLAVSYALANGSNGGKASNYTLADSTGISADINKRNLTVTANDQSKTYGDTLSLGSSSFTSSGLQNGETIGIVSLTASNSYDSSSTVDANTYSNEIAISAATGGTFSTSNYNISYVAGDLTVNPKALSVSYGAANKVYDGLTSANVTESLTGVINSDTVTVTESAAFSDANVANNKTVNITGITLGGADAGNYTLTSTASSAANISARALTITAADQSKTYGDTLSLGSSSFTSSGLQNGETIGSVTLTAANSHDSSTSVNANTYSNEIGITAATGGSFTASNYTISYVAGDLTVNPKALSVSYGAANKVYDGLTSASVTETLTGVINSDTVTVTETAAFSDANVANSKTVNITGITLGGADAGNYTLASTASSSANISARALTITAADQSKTYGDTLSLGSSSFTSSGLQNGETIGSVTLTAANNYDSSTSVDANTYSNEIGISVATGGSFSTSNYTISYVAGDLTVNPKTLSISYAGSNKVYDGLSTANVAETLTGVINSDTVTVTESAAFSDANVANGKTVNITGITLGGADAGN